MNTTNTKGTGFANIATGIGNIFNGLLGGNGAADELAALKGNYNATVNTGYNYQYGQNNNMAMMLIVLVLIGGGAYLLFKK